MDENDNDNHVLPLKTDIVLSFCQVSRLVQLRSVTAFYNLLYPADGKETSRCQRNRPSLVPLLHNIPKICGCSYHLQMSIHFFLCQPVSQNNGQDRDGIESTAHCLPNLNFPVSLAFSSAPSKVTSATFPVMTRLRSFN